MELQVSQEKEWYLSKVNHLDKFAQSLWSEHIDSFTNYKQFFKH